MNLDNKPLNRPSSAQSHLAWTYSSWFGAIVGSTSWMLVVAGFLVAWREVFVAAIPLSSFVVVNLFSIVLWRRRSRLSFFHGLMTILAVMALAFPITWFSVMFIASPQVLAAMQWPRSLYTMVGVTLIVPGTMLRFWILERQKSTNNEP